MVKILYYGHSCFLIETNKHKILIDPYFSENPKTKMNPSEIIADHILVTHAHFDHIGDTVEIAKRNKATVIGVLEVVNHCAKEGVTGEGMNIGGSLELDFGEIQLTPAIHSSSFPDGTYGGEACGFIIRVENKTIYHAGDTALTYEMKLIGEMNNIDVAILPIGDYYTMGPVDAAQAVEYIKPKMVIPMHYNTFPQIEQDPEDFADKVGDLAQVVILGYGDTHEL
jgi:L-ascorbate metabolism protein UlaG (beta-lactamase superfamily)